MRILTAILLFLAGLGLVGWSYIGGLVRMAGEMDAASARGEETLAFSMLFDLLSGGEFPQISALFYLGLLLIAVAVFRLIVTGNKTDRNEERQ